MDEATSRQAEQQLEEIGPADLLVGILDATPQNAEPPMSAPNGAAMLREAVGKLRARLHTVVIDASLNHDLAPGGNSVGDPTGPNAAESENANGDKLFTVLPAPVLGLEADPQLHGIAASYRKIFALGQQLDAKACCVVASSLDTVTSSWFYWLTQPIVELSYDLVMPSYVHDPFEGLLNSSIISPLYCALYGHDLQNPMGPDVGLSKEVMRRMMGNSNSARMEFPLVSLVPGAIGAGLKVCQAYVGRRVYPPTDWSAVSSLLPPILGPIFADVERNASIWQRIRSVRPVMTFGEIENAAVEGHRLDTARMIESFHLGIRDLREIWSLVLPPSTLLELTKLARLSADKFRMPDPLWARIIYDFAASYRLRTLNRDHLLRALTPLYLGWVASYALELEAQGHAGPSPLARLAPAFESVKPYFVSRWRWPDRFNP